MSEELLEIKKNTRQRLGSFFVKEKDVKLWPLKRQLPWGFKDIWEFGREDVQGHGKIRNILPIMAWKKMDEKCEFEGCLGWKENEIQCNINHFCNS